MKHTHLQAEDVVSSSEGHTGPDMSHRVSTNPSVIGEAGEHLHTQALVCMSVGVFGHLVFSRKFGCVEAEHQAVLVRLWTDLLTAQQTFENECARPLC